MKTLPLLLSEKFRNYLSQIDHDIARNLLMSHADLDMHVQKTFIDVSPDKDMSITFTQSNKASQLLDMDISCIENIRERPEYIDVLANVKDSNDLYYKYRSELRLGRFINTLYPDKYELSSTGGQNKSDIESFVNMYKALYNRDEKFKMMDIVSGEKIGFWYHNSNYHSNHEGSLGESCMNHKNPDFFHLYMDNTDTVEMVILYSDKKRTKIKARAILWTLETPENRKFMDRVYCNDYGDEQVFMDYAAENGWLRKSRQSMGHDIPIYDPLINDSSNMQMIANLLDDHEYKKVPYVDTLIYMNPHSGKISNVNENINAKYEMVDTDGTSYKLSSYRKNIIMVFSKHHNREIDKETARYCKIGDDWVERNKSVRVYNSGPGGPHYGVIGDPAIVQCRMMLGTKKVKKHLLKKRCTWSEKHKTWIFYDSVRIVWTKLDRSEYYICHKRNVNITHRKINGECWDKSLLTPRGNLISSVTPKVDKPIGEAPKGWHRRLEFIDSIGNIFKKGKFFGNIKEKND